VSDDDDELEKKREGGTMDLVDFVTQSQSQPQDVFSVPAASKFKLQETMRLPVLVLDENGLCVVCGKADS
jgi:hypothetical protein